jgi:hypothetical protein
MPDTPTLRTLVDERDIRAVADQLFLLTDRKDWRAAQALFVAGEIEVDMSSLVGGAPVRMTAAQLMAGFAQGLHAQKRSHHMVTNFEVRIDDGHATLQANGYAWNQVPGMPGGSDLWETWGTYRLALVRTPAGWRLAAFRYNALYNRGNEAVRTHTLAASGAAGAR